MCQRPASSEEGVLFSGTWVTDGCEPLCVCVGNQTGSSVRATNALSAESSSPKASFPVRTRLLISYSKSKVLKLKL